MNARQDLAELLSSLVSIASVNPRVKGADHRANENALAQHVKSLLEKNNINVSLQEVEENRFNVVGHLEKGKKGASGIVLLSAHMDTYPADPHEFVPKIEGNILYGRGSADAKGSLAAMLHAFLEASRSDSRMETFLVASIDEEHAMLGAKKLVELDIAPDLAITGEPTQLIPIIMQKGIVRSRIDVIGKMSHSAYPTQANVVLRAGKLLCAIEAFNAELALHHHMDALSPASVTPTRIVGDGDMNITPERVSIWFDARFLPSETAEFFLNRMKGFLTDQLKDDFFEIQEPSFVSPSNDCSVSLPLVKRFLESVQAVVGDCKPEAFSYGSEAGVLSSFAKSSLVFGPGDPKYSHKPGECVSLDEVEKASQIYINLICQ